MKGQGHLNTIFVGVFFNKMLFLFCLDCARPAGEAQIFQQASIKTIQPSEYHLYYNHLGEWFTTTIFLLFFYTQCQIYTAQFQFFSFDYEYSQMQPFWTGTNTVEKA